MSIEKLTESFFARNPDIVAKELLGRYLVRVFENGKVVKGKITEVAAYQGTARKRTSGKIKAAPGIMSVSTKYGKHLLDIATGKEGKYSCITLRSAEFRWNNQIQSINGPGKLCKILKINPSLDGLSIYGTKLWIEGQPESESEIDIKKLNNLPDNCFGYYQLK